MLFKYPIGPPLEGQISEILCFLDLTTDSLPLYAFPEKLRSDNQINSWIRSVCYWLKCYIGASFKKQG